LKRALVCLVVAFVAGCAASQQDLDAVARAESDRLPPPSRALSSFGSFELAPLEMSDAVRADDRKVAEAKDLETRLHAKLSPLLAEWNAAERSGPKLVIRPKVAGLRVVSGGARFWVGAMAGESSLDMDLALVDASTQQVIASPRIQRNAGAMAGGWSVGATDQNLLDYIAAIAHQYLVSHH
jgi:hypothetical protein